MNDLSNRNHKYDNNDNHEDDDYDDNDDNNNDDDTHNYYKSCRIYNHGTICCIKCNNTVAL